MALGIGVLIRGLSGYGNTQKVIQDNLNKVISSVKVEDDELRFQFKDGTGMKVFDNGQSCCEHRYMNCDDDLESFAGATLLDFEVADGPVEHSEYGEAAESQFLKVKTSLGVFTIANYNEHNGYYGGFSIEAETLQGPTVDSEVL